MVRREIVAAVGVFYAGALCVGPARADQAWPRPARWVEIQIVGGAPAGSADPATDLSLTGAPASPTASLDVAAAAATELDGGLSAGLALGYAVALRGGDAVRIGFGITGRSGQPFESASAFALSKQIEDGFAEVDAAAVSTTRTRIGGLSFMLSVHYDARSLADALGGVFPWVGAGVGLSRLTARSHTTLFSGALRYEDPGGVIDDTISNGRLFVDDVATVAPGWQVSAGLSWELAPQWVLSAGYRYAMLGDYRLIGRSAFAEVSVIADPPPVNETLRFDFSSERRRLDVHEALLSLRYEF
jgi:opacity protein-like surface antigen